MQNYNYQGNPNNQGQYYTPGNAPAPTANRGVPANENWKEMYSGIHGTIRNDPDLLNFAYFLYKNEYVRHYDQDDPEYIACKMRVNFCNRATFPADSTTMDTSRLEQMYTTDIFTDTYTTLWRQVKYLPGSLLDACTYCNACDGEPHSFCPYRVAHVIMQSAKQANVSPEELFGILLKENKIPFRGTGVNKLTCALRAEEIDGIDAKSAHGAYLLLRNQMFCVHQCSQDTIQYSHLPLCRTNYRNSVVRDIMSFWKTGSGSWDTLRVTDKDAFLKEKTAGCGGCQFKQCPHKLAAYFVYLANKYGEDPIDVAYEVAASNTYAGISISDNWQFNKYLKNVMESSMTKASKEEYVKMIHFIIGRNKNSKIPFLPMNTVLMTPDRDIAKPIVSDFCNAMWHFDYYGWGKDETGSQDLYVSTMSIQSLLDKYQNANRATTFCLYDIDLLTDDADFKLNYHTLLKLMEDRKKDVMTVVVATKEAAKAFLGAYPEFKKIFNKTLEMTDMDNLSIKEAVTRKLIETFTIPENVDQRLTQYIYAVYPSSPLRSMEFVNKLYEDLLFNHYNHDVHADNVLLASDIPYVTPPRSEAEIFEEINKLTGLYNVKQELKQVNDLVKFNLKMGSGSKNAVNLHMMFTGNPGTGKTTVARLTAEILHSIGFIQENKLVVCSAKDLIGEYVGQTTPKTAQKCEQAYNGVLFIDEAYQLNPYTSHQADTFKEECIAELIQQMENNRDRLVVIFAGYSDEMEDFMNKANTGLRSRIGKVIEFPDYTASELLEIFENIVRRAGMTLEPEAKAKAENIFTLARGDAKRFGNARYARNLYERSLLQHAAITANLDKDDPNLRILRSDEITQPSV